MEGYRVVTMDYACDKADIFVSATGNVHVIGHEHMLRMKHNAIVCNIGHFDSEIDIASLRQYPWENIKPQVDHVLLPGGQAHHRPCRGTAGQPRLRDRAPQLRHVELVQQPGAGANRAVRQPRSNTRTRCTCCRKSSTSALRGCTFASSARSSPLLDESAVPLHRRRYRRAVQAGSLPVLMALTFSFEFFPPNTPEGREKLRATTHGSWRNSSRNFSRSPTAPAARRAIARSRPCSRSRRAARRLRRTSPASRRRARASAKC